MSQFKHTHLPVVDEAVALVEVVIVEHGSDSVELGSANVELGSDNVELDSDNVEFGSDDFDCSSGM